MASLRCLKKRMVPFFARVGRGGFSAESRVVDGAPSSWVLLGGGAGGGGDADVLSATWLWVGWLPALVRRSWLGLGFSEVVVDEAEAVEGSVPLLGWLLSGRMDRWALRGWRFEACAFAHELIRSRRRLEGSPIEVWFARVRRVKGVGGKPRAGRG